MKKISIIAILIALFMSSCFYDDNDQHYTNIEYDYMPEMLIRTNLDTLDSITIVDSLLFEYEVSIDTGKFYAVNMYFGNILMYSKDTIRNSFWIDPYYITFNGDYELYFIAFFKSYTGSLADRYNAEYIYADTSWVVTINRNRTK